MLDFALDFLQCLRMRDALNSRPRSSRSGSEATEPALDVNNDIVMDEWYTRVPCVHCALCYKSIQYGKNIPR